MFFLQALPTLNIFIFKNAFNLICENNICLLYEFLVIQCRLNFSDHTVVHFFFCELPVWSVIKLWSWTAHIFLMSLKESCVLRGLFCEGLGPQTSQIVLGVWFEVFLLASFFSFFYF